MVVDALDECDEGNGCRASLLAELQSFKNISLMITSRPHVSIEDPINRIITLEIRASEEDLGEYVDVRINRHPRLAKHVSEHFGLQENIRRTIVERARGMFVVSVNSTKALV